MTFTQGLSLRIKAVPSMISFGILRAWSWCLIIVLTSMVYFLSDITIKLVLDMQQPSTEVVFTLILRLFWIIYHYNSLIIMMTCSTNQFHVQHKLRRYHDIDHDFDPYHSNSKDSIFSLDLKTQIKENFTQNDAFLKLAISALYLMHRA